LREFIRHEGPWRDARIDSDHREVYEKAKTDKEKKIRGETGAIFVSLYVRENSTMT